jgi:DedD protein
VERRLKERLVGAGVLVAAAIILIPEMLSGPKRSDPPPKVAEAPLKTYTIDLNRPPGAAAPSAPLEERAPPPETEPDERTKGIADEAPPRTEATAPTAPPIVQGSPDSTRAETAGNPERNAPAVKRTPEERLPAPQPTRESSPPPVASKPSVPTSRGWAIQVGSFANRATAERLVKELATSGHTAFVMPVKSGDTTLYRVRLGPFAERAAANEALVGVRKRIANAAVVAHP